MLNTICLVDGVAHDDRSQVNKLAWEEMLSSITALHLHAKKE